MTSDARRFPVGLTVAAAIGFIICAGLGVWQLQRLHWKEAELARLAALQSAPAQAIGPVLTRAARGEDVEFTRVAADCAQAPNALSAFTSSSDGTDWIWRPTAVCPLSGGAYEWITVDRGVLVSSRGTTVAPTVVLPPPAHVLGVLRPAPTRSPPASGHPAPYILVAERETPPVPGVTPAPFTAQAPDNLQYVGAYAPTWFGLAGVLACVYAAMLWRRLRTP